MYPFEGGALSLVDLRTAVNDEDIRCRVMPAGPIFGPLIQADLKLMREPIWAATCIGLKPLDPHKPGARPLCEDSFQPSLFRVMTRSKITSVLLVM